MLCARCQKNEATVHFKQIVGGVVSESHLCLSCAQEESPAPAPALQELLEMLGAARPAPASPRCPSCGLRWADFRKTGFLGCPACYEAFAAGLKTVVKEVQGAARHAGKAPAAGPAELRRRLDDALRREAFEEAARLRDQLRRLERNR